MYKVAVFPSADDEWCAIPNDRLFEEISRIDVRERWICALKKNNIEEKIAIGAYIQSLQEDYQYELHLPPWFMNSLGLEHKEEIHIKFSCSSSLPRASTLRFQVLASIPAWLDLRLVLESKLSQLGVLKKGQILPIPLLCDNEQALIANFDDECTFVFLQGEEVALELSEDMPEKMHEDIKQQNIISDVKEEQEPKKNEEIHQDIDFSCMVPFQQQHQQKFPGVGRKLG